MAVKGGDKLSKVCGKGTEHSKEELPHDKR
jgi:hypothetical protein